MSLVASDAVTVYGLFTPAGGILMPADSVGDAAVSAASPLGVTKTKHQFIEAFSRPSGTAVAAITQARYVAKAAGVVAQVRIGSVVAATGDSTATYDVRKNGTTILSGTVVLNSSEVAYGTKAGTVSVPAYAANDVFTVVVTISAGTGTLPQGDYVQIVFQEFP